MFIQVTDWVWNGKMSPLYPTPWLYNCGNEELHWWTFREGIDDLTRNLFKSTLPALGVLKSCGVGETAVDTGIAVETETDGPVCLCPAFHVPPTRLGPLGGFIPDQEAPRWLGWSWSVGCLLESGQVGRPGWLVFQFLPALVSCGWRMGGPSPKGHSWFRVHASHKEGCHEDGVGTEDFNWSED